MKLILIAGLGPALGAAGRYALTGAVLRATGPQFPWGTLAAGLFAVGLA